MPRRSSSSIHNEAADASSSSSSSTGNDHNNRIINAHGRSVAAHVRDRQRRIAEREAHRLARPEHRPVTALGHADRKKSAVTSTPFGVLGPSTTLPMQHASKKNNNGWCGPFSVARQMIAEREQAQREAAVAEAEEAEQATAHHPLDAVMEELENERKRKLHPSMSWKSSLPTNNSSSSIYAKRQKRVALGSIAQRVPTLFDLCVGFVVDHFDCVESLGNVDTSIRTAVAHELIARHEMGADSFTALAETGVEALELADCSGVPQDTLAARLEAMLPAGLGYLCLDQAGRCFGPQTVQAMLRVANKSKLFALAVGGAYLLRDADAAQLIRHYGRTLQSLDFKACPLLRCEFYESVSDTYAHNGTNKLLELSLEDVVLSKECRTALVAQSAALSNLKSLKVRRIEGVDDAFVEQLLMATNGGLESLDLSHNPHLSDATLSHIRSYCAGVRALNLSGLRLLTAQGLEALFTPVTSMSSPPVLTHLHLSGCDYEAVTNDVVQWVTQAATQASDEQGNVMTLHASSSGGLVELNAQGAALLTDVALEYVAMTCAGTLETLNVSFCPRITDQGLGYLVDRTGNQLGQVAIWGCAQISDTFLDGHRRVSDAGLKIQGAWIKKDLGIASPTTVAAAIQ